MPKASDPSGSSIRPGRPYLEKASGWIRRFDLEKGRLEISYAGFGQGRIRIGGWVPGQKVSATGSALFQSPTTLQTDPKGVLNLSGVKSGELVISWP